MNIFHLNKFHIYEANPIFAPKRLLEFQVKIDCYCPKTNVIAIRSVASGD